jgi:glucosyl-3-phosphoglycerate synthase
MSDFYQTGVVATFHRLGKLNLEKIEAELSWYSQERPIALVLPSLFSELEGDALKGIVRELKEVKYIREIVVTLGPASKEEFEYAKNFFLELPQKTSIIWNSGDNISSVYKAIEEAGLPTGEPGKGRSA